MIMHTDAIDGSTLSIATVTSLVTNTIPLVIIFVVMAGIGYGFVQRYCERASQRKYAVKIVTQCVRESICLHPYFEEAIWTVIDGVPHFKGMARCNTRIVS